MLAMLRRQYVFADKRLYNRHLGTRSLCGPGEKSRPAS